MECKIKMEKKVNEQDHTTKKKQKKKMPKKIVINTSYGGFCLSEEVKRRYKEEYNKKNPSTGLKKSATDSSRSKRQDDDDDYYYYFFRNINTCVARDDPLLIEIIESVGLDCAAGDQSVALKIIEIPDDVAEDRKWMLMENDGIEWVVEKHRTWS